METHRALRGHEIVSTSGETPELHLKVRALVNAEGRRFCYDSLEFEVLRGKEAEAIEMAFYYLDDWPLEEFDWIDFTVGSDGELGFCFGEMNEVHRGITQEECEEALLDVYSRYHPPCMEDYIQEKGGL